VDLGSVPAPVCFSGLMSWYAGNFFYPAQVSVDIAWPGLGSSARSPVPVPSLAAVWPGLSCFVFHLVSPCAQGLGSVRSPDEVPALTCFPARPLFFLLLVKLRSSLVPFIPARVGPVSNCSDCTGLFWSLARAFFGFYFIFVVVLFSCS
jgi:hypothetical protein